MNRGRRYRNLAATKPKSDDISPKVRYIINCVAVVILIGLCLYLSFGDKKMEEKLYNLLTHALVGALTYVLGKQRA